MCLCNTIRKISPFILLSMIIFSVGLACSQQPPPAAPAQQPPSQTPQQQAQPPSAPPSETPASTPPATTPAQPPVTEKKGATFTLTSTAFKEGAVIPTRHACGGEDYSPPLVWQNAPSGTKSFAIIVDDPEGFNWVHWVIFNLPSDITQLTENIKTVGKLDNGSLQCKNSFGSMGYQGPCPPSRHHYYCTIYALDSTLDVREGTTKTVVVNAMEGHILGKATLMGIYP